MNELCFSDNRMGMQTPPHLVLSEPVFDMDAGSRSATTASSRKHDAPPSLYDEAALYDAVVQPGPCEVFYREVAHGQRGPVLELACGTGRLTLPIARDGHEVVGLDTSRTMLAAAKRKAREQVLPVRFLLGDMRDFELGQRFGTVIISCNSLAHLTQTEEVRACLAAVRRHLMPAGVLAFDVVRPDLGLLSRPEGEVRRLDLGPNPSSAVEAEEVASYDPIAQVRVAQWYVRHSEGEARPMAPLVLRQFFPQELPLLLEAGGFELTARYGDFARNPLGPESLNQICLARVAG
ncbi:class I SAM-dependent DNA methyltransferase [Roseomonas sp. BN140053]|uniref:class I SAM-dependent DNA methyltransferase n=1 Tax=Roseomonas sp. BN140053 TaxID=3391898 RepID=UPI0039E9EE3D